MKKIKKTCECCGNTFTLESDCFESFEEIQEMIYCSEHCFEEAELYN